MTPGGLGSGLIDTQSESEGKWRSISRAWGDIIMVDFVEVRARLTTALLSDVLDVIGSRNQTLPPRIRPLDEASVLAGRARTALFMDVYEARPGENPYELEIAMID